MDVNLSKERITDLISQSGMSKAEFAKRLGFERNNLDAYLNSKKKDVNLVIKMADVLGMDLYEFLGVKEPEKDVFGWLFVRGMPVLVNCKEDVEKVLNSIK